MYFCLHLITTLSPLLMQGLEKHWLKKKWSAGDKLSSFKEKCMQ